MAKTPTKTPVSRLSNIMDSLRGNFTFKTIPEEPKGPVAYGNKDLLSQDRKTKILSGAFRATEHTGTRGNNISSMMGLMQSSMSQVTHERAENQKILQLMPEIDKAARLMIASIFSPNDLSRQEITVKFDCDGVDETKLTDLSDKVSNFFQAKLNLKTQAPSWVYQFGYETGAAVFAIIPLGSFEKIQEDSYVGTEDFTNKVIAPMCQESIFGFGDTPTTSKSTEAIGLESFTTEIFKSLDDNKEKPLFAGRIDPKLSQDIISKIIATESLNLTDNFAVLEANNDPREKRAKKHTNALNKRLGRPLDETIVSVSADTKKDGKDNVIGDPILIRLPPESVTVIHTPGDPNDHQGYLILLDQQGSPINALMQEQTEAYLSSHNNNQTNIFNQTYNAYGLDNGFGNRSNQYVTNLLYTQIASEHIKNRLSKAGVNQVSLGNSDSLFRCMFSRFLQQKQTRILFLPKDLVTYMTFEMDERGYGVSRLDRIKFNLGMKMAVQVSRVLASIKAAMDRRRVEVKFTDNMMEQPEAVIQNIIREYTNKSRISFSIDPNTIQSQIADKSLSIKATDVPGMETFDLTNEPDTRTGTVDFDPSILEYLDKQITNGMRVPASTMNSLNEDEYARSVTTTNLFFSMDVSIDQDIVVKHVSDLLRKYARYSVSFREKLYEIFPELKERTKAKGNSSTDETSSAGKDKDSSLPDNYTLDMIIDALSISLPKPNVAPSKAQFESLAGMVESITNLITALMPDDLAGGNIELQKPLILLRAKLISSNIRAYLAGSGMSSLELPTDNFSEEMGSINKMINSLENLAGMMNDKAKIAQKNLPPEEQSVPGY